jgi:hypothetical protein
MRDIRDFDYFLIHKDYIQPIIQGWKIVIFTIILGLITSSFYVLSLPGKLEVVAKIKMPRFNFGNTLANLDWLSTEPIKRINLHSNLQELDYLCNSHSDNKNLELMLETFLTQKNKNFLVEVIFYQDSEDLAKTCLSRLLDTINESQLILYKDLKNKFLSKKLESIDKIKKRILEDKIMYEEINLIKDFYSIKYQLIERIRHYEDLLAIDILEMKEIHYEEARYLTGSIIFKPSNKASKKFFILLFGLIGSFFISVLYILLRQKFTVVLNNLKQVKKIDN